MKVFLLILLVWFAGGMAAAAFILDSATWTVFYGVLFLSVQFELANS